MVRGVTYVGQEQYLANGHFIAACDPDTIRALLEERDALREALKRILPQYEALLRDCGLASEHTTDQARAALGQEDSRG